MSSMFGTNGVRGLVNDKMTPLFAFRLGKAIGKVMGSPVAVATDTRASADMLKSAVMSGLMASGSDVVDLGIAPTPMLQLYVKSRDGVAGGVMVTASHNSREFNGIKCISADGVESSRMEESSIEEAYSHADQTADWVSCGDVLEESGFLAEYVAKVVSHVDSAAIRSAGLKACVDCGNGAAFRAVPEVLRSLGVACVSIDCDPDAEISWNGSAGSDALRSMVIATGSDLGAAFDPDGDRCVFVDSGGRSLSGDDILAVIASNRLSGVPGRVFTPVSSSSVVDVAVDAVGGVVVHTPVGAPVIARRMMEAGGVLGGEENGGMIFPEHQYCRDAAMALAVVLECVAKSGPLGEQIDRLPEYYTVKSKMPCPEERKPELMDFLRERTLGMDVDSTDGLKVRFDDGWVLLRPSGTEPLFRVFSESKDEGVAVSRADEYKSMIEGFLEGRSASEALRMHRDDLVDVPGREYRGDPGGVRRRAHLHDVEPGQPVADRVDDLLDVHRHEAERLGGPGPGGERRVYAVYVDGEVDALVLHGLQRGLYGLLDARVHDLVRRYERDDVVPVELFLSDGAAAYDERVLYPEVLRGPPHYARVAVGGPQVLVPRVEVGVYGNDCDVVPVEVPDDGDVDGVLSAYGDGELAVPYGGAHAEVHLREHVLGKDEVVAVAVVAHLQPRLVDAVLEMDLFKIVGGPPYCGGGLPGARFETGGMVVRDAVDHDVGFIVFRFCPCVSDPERHRTCLT